MISANEQQEPKSKFEEDYDKVRNEHLEKRCKLCLGMGKVTYQPASYYTWQNGPEPSKQVECPCCEGSGYKPMKATWDEVNAPNSEQTQGQNPA